MADETTSGLGNMTELLQKQNETIAAVDESKKAQLRAAVLSKSSIEKDLGKIYATEKEQKEEQEKLNAKAKEQKDQDRDSGKKSVSLWNKMYQTDMLGLKAMLKMDKSFSEGFGEVKDAFSQDISFLSDMMSPLTAIPGVSTAMTALQFVGGKILGLLWAENRQKAKHWIKEKAQWAWEKAMAMRAAIKERASNLLSRTGGDRAGKETKKGGSRLLAMVKKIFKGLLVAFMAPFVFLGFFIKGIWKELKGVRALISKPFIWLGAKIKSIFKGGKIAGALAKLSGYMVAVRQFFGPKGPIGGVFTKLSGWFNKIGTFIKNSKVLGFAAKIGAGLAKLFWPITVIWGAIEGIKGFFKGWGSVEGGGFVDKMIAGMAGISSALLNFFIAMPMDLMKNLIAWLLEKIGFIGEDTKAAINDWSFSDLVDGLMTWMANLGMAIWNWVKAVLNGAWEAVKAMWPGGEGPMEAFARGYGEVMAAGPAVSSGVGGGGEMSGDAIEEGAEEADEAERERYYAKLDESGEGWGSAARNQIASSNTTINQGNKTYTASNNGMKDMNAMNAMSQNQA